MDRDKMAQEINRLQDVINGLDPKTDDYKFVLESMTKLTKMMMEYDELCAKQIERDDRLELESDKTMKELDIRMKELEFKIRQEEKKFEDEIKEAARQRKVAVAKAVWDIVKIALTTGCTVLLIWFTGHVEQSAILGQHQWSLIPKLFKSLG